MTGSAMALPYRIHDTDSPYREISMRPSNLGLIIAAHLGESLMLGDGRRNRRAGQALRPVGKDGPPAPPPLKKKDLIAAKKAKKATKATEHHQPRTEVPSCGQSHATNS